MLSTRSLLKLDIVGALATSATIGLIFATNLVATGMPRSVLIGMSVFAAALCVYGYAGYRHEITQHRTLNRLAKLNLTFCVVSGMLWWYHYASLTVIGKVYFPFEIVVVVLLSVCELAAAARSSNLSPVETKQHA